LRFEANGFGRIDGGLRFEAKQGDCFGDREAFCASKPVPVGRRSGEKTKPTDRGWPRGVRTVDFALRSQRWKTGDGFGKTNRLWVADASPLAVKISRHRYELGTPGPIFGRTQSRPALGPFRGGWKNEASGWRDYAAAMATRRLFCATNPSRWVGGTELKKQTPSRAVGCFYASNPVPWVGHGSRKNETSMSRGRLTLADENIVPRLWIGCAWGYFRKNPNPTGFEAFRFSKNWTGKIGPDRGARSGCSRKTPAPAAAL